MARFGAEYGNAYAIEVWSIVQRQLAVSTNWHAKCGPIPIWRNMYRKASLKAQQDLPLPVAAAAEDAMARLRRAQRELARVRAV
jgi:hypothetical protein